VKTGINIAGKVILAGLTAFMILNAFTLLYYSNPRRIPSPTGVTDNALEANSYYAKMQEGFGYGKVNNEGFHNLYDYQGQQIDILAMGSSQTEGSYVPLNNVATVRLQELFGGTKNIYNIGAAAHSFFNNANNLETALRYYQPKDYVLLEGTIKFETREMEQYLGGNTRNAPGFGIESRVLYFLQRFRYLRLLYKQTLIWWNSADIDNDIAPAQTRTEAGEDLSAYTALLDAVFRKLEATGQEAGVRLIVFYYPQLKLQVDGSAQPDTDPVYYHLFKEMCEKHGVYFLDLTDPFMEEYTKHHKLPFGFINSRIGAGHLNSNGYRIMAERMFDFINKIEAEDASVAAEREGVAP
jgi:hypothetical protein